MSELAGLREALAAEQAVVYGYGVVGAHLSGKAQRYAATRLTAHQVLRDQIAALIQQIGAVAGAAQPAYQMPFAVTDPASARRLAGTLENGAAGAAWDLAAASPAGSPARELAVGWLTDAAESAALWGASTPLPGRP
ncbi:MAG TPA: ferritin-like domain-containing protein [Mycobacteriales bacterium]|nr:ferritin-like domain-containing protein [Mycobacteriales bacterium]HWA65006.1 ferritin-like domain-containing protein [Mycobacteriales bacterium]